MNTDQNAGDGPAGDDRAAGDATKTAPPVKRDRTHWLYIAVIVAVVAGVVVGLVAPSVGKELGVLGTMFVSLIKMMIAPVIFCTIVLGIGSVRKAATVGKVGGLAFVYFLVMSTVALAIGLVVAISSNPVRASTSRRCRARARNWPKRPTSPAEPSTSSRASSRNPCCPH